MKTQLLISITGADHDGFFNQLTQKTKTLGGKWLANKFAHLDGQLAALLKLEIDEDKLPEFKSMMATFTAVEARYTAPRNSKTTGQAVTFTLEGEDRSGLTSDITHLLDENDVKVEHFESRRYPITELGTDVFEAQLDLFLPASISAEHLKSHLENLSGRMRVFIGEA